MDQHYDELSIVDIKAETIERDYLAVSLRYLLSLTLAILFVTACVGLLTFVELTNRRDLIPLEMNSFQ